MAGKKALKKIKEFFERLEEDVAAYGSRKEGKDWRQDLKNAAKKIRIKNWNLIKDD